MKAIFINENDVLYAHFIAARLKLYETRTKNTLKPCVNERVALCSTKRGRRPVVVGYADITSVKFCSISEYEERRRETKIPIGDKFDKFGTWNGTPGKWFYKMENAETCEPYTLPSSAIRHGRSWCEF